MAQLSNLVDVRKLLVERVAASRYIGRSARLRNLFVYVCERVLEDNADQIHEQELGHAVFGRSKDYDTGTDNIVRVHASLLRKRLEQYFSSEGKQEPIIIELPKGNYAPVFKPRGETESVDVSAEPVPFVSTGADRLLPASLNRRFWIAASVAGAFALLSAVLIVQRIQHKSLSTASQPDSLRIDPIVREFWSQIFPLGRQTDIVMDDASIGTYQELTGSDIRLSEYYDRNYLRHLSENSLRAKLDASLAASIVLKRQTSYASTSLLWKLGETAVSMQGKPMVRFARDYSFRELKANAAVLLGNSSSNPWIEPFDNRLGVRWKFDSERGVYYPVDSWSKPVDAERFRSMTDGGYASIALVSNLGGTGSVLILSGSGGSAMMTARDFLVDAASLARLRRQLPGKQSEKFPYFEALLHVKARNRLPADAVIVIGRAPRS